jgi:hypothetical protein
MSKQHRHKGHLPAEYDTEHLTIRGVRRKEPDWDLLVTILLAHAMKKTGADLALEDDGD